MWKHLNNSEVLFIYIDELQIPQVPCLVTYAGIKKRCLGV